MTLDAVGALPQRQECPRARGEGLAGVEGVGEVQGWVQGCRGPECRPAGATRAARHGRAWRVDGRAHHARASSRHLLAQIVGAVGVERAKELRPLDSMLPHPRQQGIAQALRIRPGDLPLSRPFEPLSLCVLFMAIQSQSHD